MGVPEDERSAGTVDGLELLAAQSRSARTAVFQAKLRPAANPAYLIPRPRLHRLLDPTTLAPLTLVVAPAGSGKTSLLRSWVAASSSCRTRGSRWTRPTATPCSSGAGCWPRSRASHPDVPVPARTCSAGAGGCRTRSAALLDDLEERDVRVPGAGHRRPAAGRRRRGRRRPRSRCSCSTCPPGCTSSSPAAASRAARPPAARPWSAGRGPLRRAAVHLGRGRRGARAPRPRPGPDLRDEIAARPAAGRRASSWPRWPRAPPGPRARASCRSPSDAGTTSTTTSGTRCSATEPDELVDVLLATSVVERVDPGSAQMLAGRADAAALLALAEARGLFVDPARARRAPSRCTDWCARCSWPCWPSARRSGCANCTAGRPGGTRRTGRRSRRSTTGCAPTGRATHCDCWRRRSAALYDGGHESTILRTIAAISDERRVRGREAMLEYAWCHLLRGPAPVRGAGRRT